MLKYFKKLSYFCYARLACFSDKLFFSHKLNNVFCWPTHFFRFLDPGSYIQISTAAKWERSIIRVINFYISRGKLFSYWSEKEILPYSPHKYFTFAQVFIILLKGRLLKWLVDWSFVFFSNFFLFESIFYNLIIPDIYICDIPLLLHMPNM